ncbi:ATP synthase subunit I [Phormidium willei BDU 130791]|nr:ATP synthase subunit I [Phormidium willei BDU 130791]
MTIARLKKVTLCGLLKNKQRILERLQDLGCMHLLPLRPPPAEVEKMTSPHAEAAYKALRFLGEAPGRRRQVKRPADFDMDAVVTQALTLKQALRDAADRRDFLEHRIAEVEPWGDLDFPPHGELAGLRLWFYMLPTGQRRALRDVALPWQIVQQDHRFIYLVVIARDEPPGDLLPVPRTHTGALPLRELRARLEAVQVELEDLAAQRQALTRYIYLMSANLAAAENRAALTHAEQQTRDEDSLVAVQGWVPVDALESVLALAEEARLACLIEEPGPDDAPPTLIEQPETMAAGVDLALFYQVPGYRTWDPSAVLIVSFTLFFAMILADAGYGLVLLAGLALAWGRLGRSDKGRGYRGLALKLFGATVIYGALVGSYFGVAPAPGSPLAAAHLLRLDDFDTMMKLSITIGVLHLVFANAMIAWVNRRQGVALAKLGWIAALLGGLTLWLAPPDSAGHPAAQGLIGGGLLAVFAFTGTRPLRRPKDYALRLLDGFKGLTGAMGAFGDVLSYMRLFALGLASASLATTFNALARDVHEGLPGLGLLAALLLLLIGHGLNLGLALISGVVHGLRLNFIEFYKWSLPEEGKPFRRFARKEVQP